MRIAIFCAMATSLLLSGCSMMAGIPGSGISATESRVVDDFHAVSVSGTADVNVQVGGEKSVVVTIDDNLIDMIRTDVVNGELRVSTEGNYITKIGLKIEVNVPTLDGISVSGVGDLKASNVNSSQMRVDVSGVGKAEVDGVVEELNVSVSGTGDAKLSNLKAKRVSVSVSGVGDATVYASESIDASASGTGDINVLGSPTDVKKSTSGVADIHIKS